MKKVILLFCFVFQLFSVAVVQSSERTPLHNAAGYGDFEKVKELLDKGADPNALDGYGRTPLQTAKIWITEFPKAEYPDYHEQYRQIIELLSSVTDGRYHASPMEPKIDKSGKTSLEHCVGWSDGIPALKKIVMENLDGYTNFNHLETRYWFYPNVSRAKMFFQVNWGAEVVSIVAVADINNEDCSLINNVDIKER